MTLVKFREQRKFLKWTWGLGTLKMQKKWLVLLINYFYCWHKHWFQSGYGSGDRASVILVQQVAREVKSSSSAICAIDWRISFFSIFLSELSDLNSMVTYSSNVSKSSDSLRTIKFNAWLQTRLVTKRSCQTFSFYFLVRMRKWVQQLLHHQQNSLLLPQRLLQGQPENDKTKTSDLKCLFLKYLILNKVYNGWNVVKAFTNSGTSLTV